MQFNSFPQSMISKLVDSDINNWHEVTKPSLGQRVYVNLPEEKSDGTPYEGSENYGEILERVNEDTYIIKLYDGESIMVEEDDFELYEYAFLPMWGEMWQFKDPIDDFWLKEMDGIQVMSDCGFRIYESEEFGYFFGIDGAGYDFYESHWIPLYKKRGLQWHDSEAENREC